MKKKLRGKLSLNRETLRQLSVADLEKAAGGTIITVNATVCECWTQGPTTCQVATTAC